MVARHIRQQRKHKEGSVIGDEFGYDYIEQRHAELLQAAEKARLIRSIQQMRKAEQEESPWRKRLLIGIGQGLVTVGTRLQQAGT
jgi:hypothetical protein